MKYKIILLSIVSIVLIAFPAYGSEGKAPDFSFEDTEGQTHSLSMYEGKVLVIEIMFSSCSVCNSMMPDLIEVYDKVKEEMGDDVQFLSVSVDTSDTNEDLDEFMEKYEATWPIGMDSSFIMDYNAMEVPKLVVISPESYIAYTHVGYIDEDEVTEEIISAEEYHYSPITEIPFIEVSIIAVSSLIISMMFRKRYR